MHETTMADTLKAAQNEHKGEAMHGAYYRHPTLLEEMEKKQIYEAEAAKLRERGIQFLRDHPDFNEFISLIRQGAISI